MGLLLVVYATNGVPLTDSSRLPKTLSPSSSQTMRLLYKSHFFLSLIIFICALGLQGKVASSFQTFPCYHCNSCSVLKGNELPEYYTSCFDAFGKKNKKALKVTKWGIFHQRGTPPAAKGREAVLRVSSGGTLSRQSREAITAGAKTTCSPACSSAPRGDGSPAEGLSISLCFYTPLSPLSQKQSLPTYAVRRFWQGKCLHLP